MEEYINNELCNIAEEYDYGNNLNKLLYVFREMEDKNEEIEIILETSKR